MRAVLILAALLLVPFAVLQAVVWFMNPPPFSAAFAGCAAFAVLLLATGTAHFVVADRMAEMIPPFFPFRVPLVYGTGLFEWAMAAGLLFPATRVATGWVLLAFLIAVFPANVWGALRRIPLGGHELGLPYLLWFRAPAQLLLLGWTYWFAIRSATR